jgi:hypothetical protein
MKKPASSFAHEIHPLTEEDWKRMGPYEREYLRCGCSMAAGCGEPITHWLRYRYVTGRAGRVSDALRYCCVKHAWRFASKFGIEVTKDLEQAYREIADKRRLEEERILGALKGEQKS